MAGQHLNDLLHRTRNMSSEDVLTAQVAWENTATSLDKVHEALATASEKIPEGLGGEQVRDMVKESFTLAAQRVGERHGQVAAVSAALKHASTAMAAAEQEAKNPPGAPGEAPPVPESTNDPDVDAENMTAYAKDKSAYNEKVTAYGDADERARKKVQALLEKYDAAVTAFQAIEGGEEKEPNGPGTPTGPGGPRYTPPPRSTPVGTWIGSGGPGDIGNPVGPENPTGDPDYPDYPGPGGHVPGYPGPGYNPPPIDTLTPNLPPLDPGPGGVGSGGTGDHTFTAGPAVLGGAAAGVFGAAPGVVRGLRGLVGGRGLGSSGVGAIGSSTRAGGPGSLGRAGAGTPGSPVGRGTGRGGAAGRGGAGGRGGGAAGAAGGRGRRRDEKDGQDRDLFDDGEDWIDDEGAGPGVLS
ncbi:hypothetical protein [Nocardioides nitrophenolicus]|uniref:hypothetical protein n=1 Tax=Nocardioides nitrophenolicus TaxID=60489 RepID=UPI001958A964|nr:hypothetical protein [Nocardioides nitrophenolicus]MBM7516011.1 hypothetical protein [Nocardioides nitrophenolicus]